MELKRFERITNVLMLLLAITALKLFFILYNIPDWDILIRDKLVILPIINFEINIFLFCFIGPLLILGIHLLVIIFSNKLWSIFENMGKNKINYGPNIISLSFMSKGIYARLLYYLTRFIIYLLPIIIISFFFVRFLDYQNFYISFFHVLCIVIILYIIEVYGKNINNKIIPDESSRIIWDYIIALFKYLLLFYLFIIIFIFNSIKNKSINKGYIISAKKLDKIMFEHIISIYIFLLFIFTSSIYIERIDINFLTNNLIIKPQLIIHPKIVDFEDFINNVSADQTENRVIILKNRNLFFSKIKYTHFRNTVFINTHFSKSSIEHCIFSNCSFIDCTLKNVKFQKCGFFETKFHQGNKESNFIEFVDCEFLNSKLNKYKLNKSLFTNTLFFNSEIIDAIFSNMSFSGTKFICSDILESTINHGSFNDVIFYDVKNITPEYSDVVFEVSSFINCLNIKIEEYGVIYAGCNFNNNIFSSEIVGPATHLNNISYDQISQQNELEEKEILKLIKNELLNYPFYKIFIDTINVKLQNTIDKADYEKFDYYNDLSTFEKALNNLNIYSSDPNQKYIRVRNFITRI